ncbi:MAG: MerR family transcriptional regulator [Brachymonas sp.]|nr:MerR family transcriptional regulator [Brachymonas sp.]
MKTPVLPPIPAKRYFTIGEVADLCAVKPHVLRYWEQEFTQLNPMKRRGNRRYYQHHEVLMVRRIRDLLYEQGFTISGARSQLDSSKNRSAQTAESELPAAEQAQGQAFATVDASLPITSEKRSPTVDWRLIRQELEALRNFLS